MIEFILFLEMLDGKQITENSRQFLVSWKASREAQQLRDKSKTDILTNEHDYVPSGGELLFIVFSLDGIRFFGICSITKFSIDIISFFFSATSSIEFNANTIDAI